MLDDPLDPPVDPPEAPPEPVPLTLEQHLSKCYKADALRTGEPYDVIAAAFASALAEDSEMKSTARAKLGELQVVNKARNGKDWVTTKQIKYLTDALGA